MERIGRRPARLWRKSGAERMIRIILEIEKEDDQYLNLSRLIEDILKQDKLMLPKFRYQSELITDSIREAA
jgi:hypothetical protein